MVDSTPLIYVVDDDVAIRDSLQMLLESHGYRVCTCESAQEFLALYQDGLIGCVLLDLRMPRMSGLELQSQLHDANMNLPVIFVTAHGDVAQCRRAFQTGAVDFLSKPIDSVVLMDAIQRAVELCILQAEKLARTQEVEKKLSCLTPREHDVLGYVVSGLSSKQIAAQLNLSPRTVETHRANLFAKLAVNSLAELIRLYLSALENRNRLHDSQ